MVFKFRAHNLCRGIGVLLRVPENEDAVLAVALVTENRHALATRLRCDQRSDAVSDRLGFRLLSRAERESYKPCIHGDPPRCLILAILLAGRSVRAHHWTNIGMTTCT